MNNFAKSVLGISIVVVAISFAAPSEAALPWKKKKGEKAETEQTQEQKGTPSWMNANGEVTDASQAEEGYGQKVKGINDWEGEITGKFVPGSKFDQLKIGMPLKQVTDIVGEPTDSGAYVTGKAWIPFYHGSGRHRQELVYKGKGRLIFDGKGGYDSGANLIWIINSASEPGYRN